MDVFEDLQNMDIFEKVHSFKLFDVFGIMPVVNAVEFINAGLFRVEEISVLPLTQTLTVIHLTQQGREASKNFLSVWALGYEPFMESRGIKLIDEYANVQGSGLPFALSISRFEAEQKAGRLSKVISMCPNILQPQL